MYSRHSFGFLASSRLTHIRRASGLQVPHFVFIFLMPNSLTLTPILFSHNSMRSGRATFNCFRYHSSSTDCFFSKAKRSDVQKNGAVLHVNSRGRFPLNDFEQVTFSPEVMALPVQVLPWSLALLPAQLALLLFYPAQP